MSTSLLGACCLATLLWVLSRRFFKTRSPLADVAGPEKEHWLKGEFSTCLSLNPRRICVLMVVDRYRKLPSDLSRRSGVQSRTCREIRRCSQNSCSTRSTSSSAIPICDHRRAQRYSQDEQLYVSDPLALHYIVVKEQDVYEETDMFITGNKLIFGEGLISTLGEQHRKQRKMLNPVFSMGNMRNLLPIVQPIASQLCTVLTSQLPGDGGE